MACGIREEVQRLCEYSEEMNSSVSLLSKIVLQYQPDCDVGKKKEDDVAQATPGADCWLHLGPKKFEWRVAASGEGRPGCR